MSEVYVRAKNAAFYLNPILACPRGLILFEEGEPLLVIWNDRDNYDRFMEIVRDMLGDSRGWSIVALLSEQPMPVVTTPPPHREHMARVYRLKLSRRIPTPSLSGGHLKYRSRVPADIPIVDLPSHPNDAYEI